MSFSAFRQHSPTTPGSSLPTGALYDLDRTLPLGQSWIELARFRGNSRAVTRWFTRAVAPRLAQTALNRWRMAPSAFLKPSAPFLLCLSNGELREGLRLLVGEWLEFRRIAPHCPWRLVIRTNPVALDQPKFELVAPFWQQVQALRQQLGIRRGRVHLWVRTEDDAGDEALLDAAGALVVVARHQGFSDPLTLALEKGKAVLAPRLEGDSDLPADYPYQFATRPAVLRFVGEPRRLDTASVAWPMPEPLALAKLIHAAAADPESLKAAGVRAAQHWMKRNATAHLKVPVASER